MLSHLGSGLGARKSYLVGLRLSGLGGAGSVARGFEISKIFFMSHDLVRVQHCQVDLLVGAAESQKKEKLLRGQLS